MKRLCKILAVLGAFLFPLTPALAETAKELLADMIENAGGVENFAAVDEIHITRSFVALEESGEAEPFVMKHRIGFPESLELKLGAEERIVTLGNSDDWDLKSFLWREWFFLAARIARDETENVTIERLEDHWEGGFRLRVLKVSPDGAEAYELYLNASTGLPYKRRFWSNGAVVDDIYSDWREVDGLLFPYLIKSYADGKLGEKIVYDKVAFSGHNPAPTLASEVRKKVLLTMMDKGIPGLSVALTLKGEIIHSAGYGLENLEYDMPARPETIYVIASVTKIFAGTLAMMLVEEGNLDLDAKVGAYLPDLPETIQGITVRQLLSHTHGINDFFRNPDFEKEGYDDNSGIIKAASLPFKFEPGTAWSYSLVGYVILQKILEAAGGKPFPDQVAEKIFQPLEMNASTFGNSTTVIPNFIPINYIWRDGELGHNIMNYDRWSYTGAGLNASVHDLTKFLLAIENDQLMSQQARDEMWKAVRFSDDQDPYYALGWSSYTSGRTGTPVVGHEGGGSAWVYYWLEEEIGIIMLGNLNGSRADNLVGELGAIVEAFGRQE